MAEILLVDSNPEHVRSLDGIVKYRTRHQIEVVPDCVSALRRIHLKRPDLILINVLLYGSEDFGFAKALSESPEHATIPVAVHISGHVGDLTQRRIEALGARLLELPISADEIEVELHRTVKVKVSGIETVTWGQAAPEAVKSRGPQRSGAPKAPAKSGVRSVNWAVDGTASDKTPDPKPAFRAVQPKSSTRPSAGEPIPAQKPKHTTSRTSGGFAPLASSAERVEGPTKFVPESEWKKVEPKNVKNRHRSTKRP